MFHSRAELLSQFARTFCKKSWTGFTRLINCLLQLPVLWSIHKFWAFPVIINALFLWQILQNTHTQAFAGLSLWIVSFILAAFQPSIAFRKLWWTLYIYISLLILVFLDWPADVTPTVQHISFKTYTKLCVCGFLFALFGWFFAYLLSALKTA